MPTISTDKVTGSRSISRTEAEINDSTTPITKCPSAMAKGTTLDPITRKQLMKDRREYRDRQAQYQQESSPTKERINHE